jgi:hypothetical protein
MTVVERVTDRATQRVTEEVSQRVEARTAEVERRLEDLADEMARRRSAVGEQHRATVDALEDVSWESVASALAAANRINALSSGRVVAAAADDPAGIKVIFSWGSRQLDPGWGDEGIWSEPELLLELEPPDGSFPNGGRMVVEELWSHGEDPVNVGGRLEEALVRAGWWDGAESFDWPEAIRNFRRTIDIAVGSRRKLSGAWQVDGPVVEVVGDDWVITTTGVYAPSRDFSLAASEFPTEPPLRRVVASTDRPKFQPDAPSWADRAEFEHVIRVALEEFHLRGSPMAALVGHSSWRPSGDDPVAPG